MSADPFSLAKGKCVCAGVCVCACARDTRVCAILKCQMLLEKPVHHLQGYLSHLKYIVEAVEQSQLIQV